ncbi:MAG: VCBS repeat-containing protein, partial [Planctomycetota bacterium]|nr:VCBS repeat-containing protein [Planctomycetota bacterium]
MKPTSIFLGIPLLLFFSCGQEGGEEMVSMGGIQQEGVLIQKQDWQLPVWAEDNLKRRDPGYDRWKTEVLHGSAKKSLKAIFHHALGVATEEEPTWDQLLAHEFGALLPLVPEKKSRLHDGAGILVERGKEFSSDILGKENLKTQFQNLLSVFQNTKKTHLFFKYLEVKLIGENQFETQAVIHLDDLSSKPYSQLNLEWQLGWEIAKDGETLRLQSVRPRSWEWVQTSGPLFSEVTQAVLGDVPQFKEEIMTGVGGYQWRTDQMLGNSYIGAQGVAVGDVNGDGFDDIFMPQQGGIPNRLYLRRPDGALQDATELAGLSFLDNTRSALILDFDNDGDQDIALAVGPNLLIGWNNGTGAFSEFTPLTGVGPEDVYSMVSADADKDGDLDIYCCRYVQDGLIGGVPTPYHDADNGAPNMYWQNDGNHQFSLATDRVGFGHNNSKFSLAALWEDFDQDGDPDLYVTNDFGKNNLYLNEGGHFRDVAQERGAEDLAAGMGVTCEDFDLDGDMDLYVSNMFSSAGQRIVPQTEQFMGGENTDVHQHYQRHARGNTLLSNNGAGFFEDSTDTSGAAIGGWAWGAKSVDFNNDGFA